MQLRRESRRIVVLVLVFRGALSFAQPIFDELTGQETGIITEGPTTSFNHPDAGTAWFAAANHGTIVVKRNPGLADTVSMSRRYENVAFPYDSWVHIRWRKGSDIYGSNSIFGSNTNIDISLNGTRFANFNFNGAAHWQQFTDQCLEKSIDDELVIGQLGSAGQWINDHRVAYPPQLLEPMCDAELSSRYTQTFTDTKNCVSGENSVGLAPAKRYSDWHILSVKFHLDSSNWNDRAILFFIDGRRVLPVDIDGPLVWDQRTSLWPGATNSLKVEFSTFADNWYCTSPEQPCPPKSQSWGYYYYNNYRHTGCSIFDAPGVPGKYAVSQRGVSNPTYDYFDFVLVGRGYTYNAATISDLIYQGRVSASTAIFTEMITWQAAQTWCQWMSIQEISEVRQSPYGSPSFCSGR